MGFVYSVVKNMNTNQYTFNIDTHSGSVQWGDVSCHPQLKIDDFQKQHPKVRPAWREDGRGLWRSEIQLPRMPINNELWNAKIAYENQFLRRIECTAGGLTRDIPEAHWWYFHLRWMICVKEWLVSNFDYPTFVDPTPIYDESHQLSEQEMKLLETWQYVYDWGTMTFAYESLEMRSSLTIEYDSSTQIRDWNELLQVCHWAIKLSQSTGKSTTNLSLIRDTIALIGQHFKYDDFNPKISQTGLIFRSNELSTYIDMEIWRNSNGKNYRLYRRDTTTEIKVPSDYELLSALRSIFELE